MPHLPIGIDLGTSTSEIAVFQHGEPVAIADPVTKRPIVPSLIAVNHTGQLLVGEDARDFIDLPDHGVREIKRRMGSGETLTLGGQTYRPEELSALLLRKLKHNAEVTLGEPITEVVLSVPANFPDPARQATLHAAELAGLHVVRLVNEPTAAALAFGVRHIDLEAQLVVFDFGGGTLDVSVLEMVEGVLDVRSSFGDPQLGGKDFDEALMALLLERFTAEHGALPISDLSRGALKSAAERAKITLSDAESTEVFLPGFALDQGRPVDLVATVTRDAFETAVAPLLARARQVVTQALAAGQIKPDAIDRVLLVGGATYIPCVRRLVAEMFGAQPSVGVDPDLAVTLGAATLAAMEAGVISPEEGLILTDVSPFGIGIETMDPLTYELMYSPLIKPNTPIPFTHEYAFSLLHAHQEKVLFHLYQSYLTEVYPMQHARARQLVTDTGIAGEIVDIPPALNGMPHPVRIDFSYDENGLVSIHATIPGLAHEVRIDYQQTVTRMTPEELDAARQRLEAMFENLEEGLFAEEAPEEVIDATERYWTPVIAKAERLAVDHPDHSADLLAAIVSLRDALASEDTTAIDAAGDQLADLIADLEED